MCSACISRIKHCIEPVKSKEEFLTGRDEHDKYILSSFDASISCCTYEGAARDMVHGLKYQGKKDISISMAAMMYEVIKKSNLKFDVIVSVPIHKNRVKKRGYNQAQVIAIELSNISSIPYMDILERKKDTPSQVLFNGGERWYNVMDAFSCSNDLTGKRVLLVDDVVTTGATACFCSKALREVGACYITVVSFARA